MLTYLEHALGSDTASVILRAGSKRFSAYGFRRTSMEDIALEASVSRATLYTYFSSKKAIFRRIAGALHDEVHRRMDEVLAADESLDRQLRSCFRCWTEPYREVLFGSPHGQELIGLGGGLAEDLGQDSLTRFRNRLADHLGQAVAKGHLQMGSLSTTPQQASDYLVAALNGISSAPGGNAHHLRRVALLVETFLAATLCDQR